jgi:hypothetical protein
MQQDYLGVIINQAILIEGPEGTALYSMHRMVN